MKVLHACTRHTHTYTHTHTYIYIYIYIKKIIHPGFLEKIDTLPEMSFLKQPFPCRMTAHEVGWNPFQETVIM